MRCDTLRRLSRVAHRGRHAVRYSESRRWASSEMPQLLRVADRVDTRDATVADDERERRPMAVAARQHEAELPVQLDLDRFVRGLATDRRPRARNPRAAAHGLA